MNLRFRKKIIPLVLSVTSVGIIASINSNSVSPNAATLLNVGVDEYNGIFNDQAYAWSGSDRVGYVDAELEAGLNNFIGFTPDWDGWVQTPQKTYKSTTVRGLHSAGSGTTNDPWDFRISNP